MIKNVMNWIIQHLDPSASLSLNLNGENTSAPTFLRQGFMYAQYLPRGSVGLHNSYP
jgi:hypothetical protein